MKLTLLIVIIVSFVVVAVVLAILKSKRSVQEGIMKVDVYYLKKSLFSPAERSFLGVLEMLDYDGVTIASKVRLADIFGTKKGLERADRLRALNRITAKHVDFLLIQKSDGRPLLGIELDDSSHEEQERVVRDLFVDTVFASAGLPILHVTAKAAYDMKEIHRRLEESLANSA